MRGRRGGALLGVRRDRVRAAVPDGAPVVHDPHNDDPRYSRVRARHAGLPVLARELGPGTAEALARTAALALDDADLLDSLSVEALPAPVGEEGREVPALVLLPPALRSRSSRPWVVWSGAPAPGSMTRCPCPLPMPAGSGTGARRLVVR